MSNWEYVLFAVLACVGWGLLGYISRKTYNRITDGRNHG